MQKSSERNSRYSKAEKALKIVMPYLSSFTLVGGVPAKVLKKVSEEMEV